MSFKKTATNLLIVGMGMLGGLQYINAQINPFNPVTTKSQELIHTDNSFDTHQILDLDPSPLESITISSYEGIMIALGKFDITRNSQTNNPIRITSEMPNEQEAYSTLTTIIETIQNYPPYMLREKCNIHAIYLTSNLIRNEQRLNGMAFKEGIVLISAYDTTNPENYLLVKKNAHHEFIHECEFANITDYSSFNQEWKSIASRMNMEIEYVGEDWRNLDHSATYEGFTRSYSLSEPIEHRATMWEDVMTDYHNAQRRSGEDSLYEKYFYEIMYLMREWSHGLMDLEIYEIISNQGNINNNYYVEKFGENAFIFKPVQK